MASQKIALVSAGQELVAPSIPFRYAFIAVMVVIVVWHWRSTGGAFHTATQRGGWRLVIAVVSSIGILAFGFGVAMGQLTILIMGLIVGAPLAAGLYFERVLSSRKQ